MATYKTISCKAIIRKVMRDLNPGDGNWIYDAVEWIGEALEHIGAGAHVESKGCIIEVDDFKATLPADVYYINQVAINQTEQEQSLSAKIADLRKEITDLTKEYSDLGNLYGPYLDGIATSLNFFASSAQSTSLIANAFDTTVNGLEKTRKTTDKDLNKLVADAQVIYTAYMNPTVGNLTPIQYCTTNFPRGIHCDKCVNEFTTSNECYLVENDRIKTSFRTGKLCLSYTAFATDTECWPLIPDDISFKEAMFWYIYKKLLLGASFDPSTNGIDYSFADQQWKFYCTQARNEAKYPDMARYESFMNQWVRLVPRISEFDNVMGTLNTRENLYRGNYSTNSIA